MRGGTARGIGAVTVALALGISHGAAVAAPVVQQGGLIVVGSNVKCTVAMNDKNQGVSYTSAHCGSNGDRVTVQGAEGLTGTFIPSPLYRDEEDYTANDWAMVVWDDGVALGPNWLSGDTLISPGTTLTSKDRVCTYGGVTKAKRCGSFAARLGNTVFSTLPDGQAGDSGAPVWVEGKGMIGPYSGVSNISSSSGVRGLSRAVHPEDGRDYGSDDEIEVLKRWFHIDGPVVHTAKRPVETAANAGAQLGKRLDSLSSEDDSAVRGVLPVVLAIVLGVLVAAAPDIVSIVESWRSIAAARGQ
ncbi:hypothetical protein BJP05_08280 [Corynebacterium sp. NML98-0116]|uniref:Peptidase S1 domain-containing protein n=1 Tax=Corynebacterium pseudogenitalium TaxID=38303 RepID=A0ABD4TS03_9CORY|nr:MULTISPECIES: hypothetical protein [Corynebacterium]AOX06141.1 hypothetical protein BJP05_08280 [Corynebacterium sp. NML98-0116]MCQ4614008.1 hypothetical protein [Corynebacterium pseudogenitalium]